MLRQTSGPIPRDPIPCNGFPSHHLLPPNPRKLIHPVSSSTPTFNFSSTNLSLPSQRSCLPASATRPVLEEKSRSAGIKYIDVATLGNLCVDIVLNVPNLPPRSFDARKAYMERLSAAPPDKKYWEAGGNCNMVIAAARLGLNCVTVGHVGNEIYGNFLIKVLNEEGISMAGMTADTNVADVYSVSYETLLCWVLVDPLHRHGFCSPADFSDEPAFSWLSNLSEEVKMAIKQSKIIFCNGYVFDELPPRLIIASLEYASDVGTSIFFDPGPRGRSLLTGTPEEQKALHYSLAMSDVLLLTSEEAEALTDIRNPILAGQELLRRGVHTKWVIVKLGSKGSILISLSSVSCAPAFKVNVIDTVGCGDSFVAAIAFGFIHRLPMICTLAAANAVGAATAMGCGAGRNVARLEQVIQLMRASSLNEDDTFWDDILGENIKAQKITVLSKHKINGSSDRLNRVSLQEVLLDLLPKLESARVGRKVLH